MSTLGPQEVAPPADTGPWELIGRDVIRTKLRRGDNGQPTGGQIIAQFWTSPTPEHARLMTAAPDLVASLADVLRILDAVRYSAGLGTKQLDRMDKARAALAKAKGGAS